MRLRAIIFVVLTVANQAWARTIPCSEGQGQTIELTENTTLPRKCHFYGSLKISRSDLTLDCQGATLWGVPSAFRSQIADLAAQGQNDFLEQFDPAGYGILIESPHAIDNVTVRNCRIKAFQQAIRIRHSMSGSRWLWEMAAQDKDLSGPLRDFLSNHSKKHILLQALSSYPWENSNLPERIRALAPKKILIENVKVDLTSQSGIYVDHHVSEVRLDKVVVTRTGGPGVYLEYGSRRNIVRNSEFRNNGREGIAVDSSADNIIEKSTFNNNRGGGIMLYRNCWEFFEEPGAIGTSRERRNYFPRTQGSDNNQILQNNFLGNSFSAMGKNVGIAVASRQSKIDTLGCGLYRMNKNSSPDHYHEDRAKNVKIVGNTFSSMREGIVIEDDGAEVFGNIFQSNIEFPIRIDAGKREELLNKPISRARIAFNVIFKDARTTAAKQVVKTRGVDINSCSTFGLATRERPLFDSHCTTKYLQILANTPVTKYFPNSVRWRIEKNY